MNLRQKLKHIYIETAERIVTRRLDRSLAIQSHLEARRPGIERIKTLCEESLDHNVPWWEFEKCCRQLLELETKQLTFLKDLL